MATVLIRVIPDDDWQEVEIEIAEGQQLIEAVTEAGYTNHFFKLKEE